MLVQLAETDAKLTGDAKLADEVKLTVESLPRVEGDAGQFRQLVQNLLSNAINCSGDEPSRIDVAAEPDGGARVISVSDGGIAIDPDDREGLFDIFDRLHGRETYDGTGIGLAVCERIVARHGGEIRVDSGPGEGSTFSSTVPDSSD